MPKRATTIQLHEQEREALTRLVRRHRSEQQVVLRACIILAAAQGSSNAQIARKLGINVDTVRLWRDRWAGGQEIEQEKSAKEPVSLVQRLQDAPRPRDGNLAQYSSAQVIKRAISPRLMTCATRS